MSDYYSSDSDNKVFSDFDSDLIVRSATRYLWCGESEYCNCGHHLTQHSKNSEPEAGRCVASGCYCTYFHAYRNISEEVQT